MKIDSLDPRVDFAMASSSGVYDDPIRFLVHCALVRALRRAHLFRHGLPSSVLLDTGGIWPAQPHGGRWPGITGAVLKHCC